MRVPDIPWFLNLDDDPKWQPLRVLWLESKLTSDARNLMERRQQVIDHPKAVDINLDKSEMDDLASAITGEIRSVMAEIRAYQERQESEADLDTDRSNNESH